MAIQHLHVFGLFVKQGIDIESVFSVGSILRSHRIAGPALYL